MSVTLTISHARSYIHAGDELYADLFDRWMYNGWETPTIPQDVCTYIVGCLTPDVRNTMLDRKVKRITKRLERRVGQIFVPYNDTIKQEWLTIKPYGAAGSDVYVVIRDLHTPKAASTWFDAMMGKYIAAMDIKDAAHMMVNEPDNLRLARDGRRRIDSRIDAFAAAMTGNKIPRAQEMQRELQLEYVKWMLGLVMARKDGVTK